MFNSKIYIALFLFFCNEQFLFISIKLSFLKWICVVVSSHIWIFRFFYFVFVYFFFSRVNFKFKYFRFYKIMAFINFVFASWNLHWFPLTVIIKLELCLFRKSKSFMYLQRHYIWVSIRRRHIFFLLNFHFLFKNSLPESGTKFIFSVVTMNLFIHTLLYPIWMLWILLRRYFSLFNLHYIIEISLFTLAWFNRILPNEDIPILSWWNRLWNKILW